MKALLFTDSGKSSITDLKKPTINDFELLVKVKSCAICGTDIKLDKGSSTKLTKHGIKNMIFPRITGHEISGIIEDKGKKVKEFKIGNNVNISPVIPCMNCNYCKIGRYEMCDNKVTFGFDVDGGFAEYIRIPEIAIKAGCINKITSKLSFEEATFAEPLAVVLNSQERSKVKSGDSILIIGAGPIGILQIQIAQYNKASKIIVAEIFEERLDFAKNFSPNALVNSKNENFVDTILDLTKGDGVDVVMICASDKNMFAQSLKITKKLGRINYFAGLPKDDSIISLDANLIHYNELEITGTSDSTPNQSKKAIELLNDGKVKVNNLITHKYSLEKYFEGLEMAKSGKAMKVIINI
ncbi:MAG: zinc-dependent dehydrogenase [Candidatus Humimicrobiaceae bacterium]